MKLVKRFITTSIVTSNKFYNLNGKKLVIGCRQYSTIFGDKERWEEELFIRKRECDIREQENRKQETPSKKPIEGKHGIIQPFVVAEYEELDASLIDATADTHSSIRRSNLPDDKLVAFMKIQARAICGDELSDNELEAFSKQILSADKRPYPAYPYGNEMFPDIPGIYHERRYYNISVVMNDINTILRANSDFISEDSLRKISSLVFHGYESNRKIESESEQQQ